MFTLCEDLMITGIQIGIMCGKDADILWLHGLHEQRKVFFQHITCLAQHLHCFKLGFDLFPQPSSLAPPASQPVTEAVECSWGIGMQETAHELALRRWTSQKRMTCAGDE